jgi:ABC-type dipeptide/oligopeptide/nickel transport system permease subunit
MSFQPRRISRPGRRDYPQLGQHTVLGAASWSVGRWTLVVVYSPGACIAILGAGLSLINFGIDEIADPRLRIERPAKVEKH